MPVWAVLVVFCAAVVVEEEGFWWELGVEVWRG